MVIMLLLKSLKSSVDQSMKEKMLRSGLRLHGPQFCPRLANFTSHWAGRLPNEDQAKDSSATVDEILKTLKNKRQIDFQESKAADLQTPAYRTSVPDLSSMILDGMLVIPLPLRIWLVILNNPVLRSP